MAFLFERTDIREWEKAVTMLADAHENRRFLNDSVAHAKILAGLMIGRSKDSALIFSGSLREDCYGESLGKASGKLRILVEDAGNLGWIARLPNAGQIEVRKVGARAPAANHFFVADAASFRLERDHKKASALANFNEPDTCQVLTARFNVVWPEAEAVSCGG
jgi:hypothetical protein